MPHLQGGGILSCKNDLIGSFLEPETANSITISDAKEWFEQSYLEKFSNFRLKSKSAHERDADWDRALYSEVKNKGKCVIVPIKYLNKFRPAFAAWDSKNDFVEKLLEYYTHPILEVLVVYNDDKDRPQAYLSQIAYDGYHLSENQLDIDQYYGWFLKSDWDDNVLEAAYYEKGRQKLISKNGSTKARLALDCGYYYTGTAHFSHVEVDGAGNFEIVWQKEYIYYCFGAGSGGSANQEYPYEVDEGNLPEGGGGYSGYIPVTTNFNIKNAICNPGGSDRYQMNQSLQNALSATGLGAGVTGWTFDKADAILRSVGANIDDFRPLTTAGRRFGVAGGVLGGMRGVIGLFDGDISDHDALDIIGGVIGVGLAFTPAGWIGVAIGGVVTLGIAIYESTNQPISIYNYCN